LQLVTAAILGDAPLEAAVSHALLDRVGAGELPETFRVAPTPAMVSFGRLDTHAPGFPDAVRAAQAHGFAAVHRLAGGRAAAFHPETLVFSWTVADDEPRAGPHRRFGVLAALAAGTMEDLGLQVRVGALPREYCPGDYSLHRAGVKVGGISQRVTKSASSTEGVLVVRGGDRVRDVLVPVYAALGLDWDPATAGDLGGPSVGDVQETIIARLARDHALAPAELDAETLALARRYAARHDAGDGRPPKRLLGAPVT
jgi:octanoyl-[GcvH]:protein N-octanoyltransferase